MPSFDFTAVGFLVLDILGRPADEFPPEGGATFIDEVTMTVAGTAGATALDCAILGLNGQLSARVGQDVMGDFLVANMREHGLNTDLVQRDATVQTSCSMLPIRPNGARAAFHVPGTSTTFLPTPAEVDRVMDADIVHLGGTGLLTAFDGEPSLELLKRAKSLDRLTVFDLILANPETVEKVEPLLPFIDYFVPSIDEAAAMSGGSGPEEVAAWFKQRGVKNAILTLEGHGVFVDPADGDPFRQPAHQVDVVDTTGCGDSFTAGIIVAIAKGWGIRDCARFANAVAAQVAMALGSQGRLSSFDSAVEAMNTWPLRE